MEPEGEGMTDLKPCPFCGGEASIWEDYNCDGLPVRMIGCQACDLGFMYYNGYGVEDWNRRAYE